MSQAPQEPGVERPQPPGPATAPLTVSLPDPPRAGERPGSSHDESGDEHSDGAEPSSAAPARDIDREPRLVRAAIGLVLLLHLAALLRRSWLQWNAGSVSQDFAIFHQAWALIGSGHLDPDSTIVGYPYWQSHFELIMWPLALLHPLFPSGFTLLVLQDLAIVGAELMAVLWVLEVTRRDRSPRLVHLLPVAVTLLLLVTNERIWAAAKGDFHFQAFATLALLGAGRAVWRGQKRAPWVWVLLALLTGDVAGTYVAGLGLSALVARKDTRLTGLALIVAGGVWTAGVGLLGANRGSAIGGYQHLVDDPLPAGGAALLMLVAALVLHPGRPLSVLWGKAGLFRAEFTATGLLGLVHPWTFGVVLVVAISGGLQQSLAFFAPFQNFPALVFGTAGTGMVLDWLGRRAAAGAGARARGVLLGRVALAVAVVLVVATATVGRRPAEASFPEPASAAGALDQVQQALRPGDEVIASFGLVGRFAGRENVFYFIFPASVPVAADQVVFVFSPTVGNMPTPGDQLTAAETVRALGATPIVQTDDVLAFRWTPPAGTTQIQLPVALAG